MEGTPLRPGPGWYLDPENSSTQRWWDGERWTDHTHTGAFSTETSPTPVQTDGFAIAALVLSILGGIVLSAVLAIVALSRIKRGKRAGRGLAIAALCMNPLWATLIGLGIAGVFDDEPDADRYTGEQRKVASVVDDFERTAKDKDFHATCALLTPAFDRAIARTGSSCERTFAEELGDAWQADIAIQTVIVHGPAGATVVLDEGGTTQRWRMVKQDATWRIAQIDSEE